MNVIAIATTVALDVNNTNGHRHAIKRYAASNNASTNHLRPLAPEFVAFAPMRPFFPANFIGPR
jgi:hypothetical protein